MRFRRRGDANREPLNIIEVVEGLSDGDRWAYMLALGQRSLSEPVVKAQIDGLAASANWYPRKLALMACFASRDKAIILSCLTDASCAIAAVASGLAMNSLDDAALIDVLPTQPKRRLKRLAKGCAKHHRTAVAEAVFDHLDGDGQVALASAVSSEFLSKRLEGDFAERLSATDWGRVSVRHPKLVCETFARIISQSEDLPRHLIFSANEAVWRMCDGAPRFALELTRQLLNHISIQSLPLAKLAALYPQEVAALAIAAPPKATVFVSPSWLRAVDDATRLALVRRSHSPLSPGEFSKLPPRARAQLYAAGLIEPMRGKEGALPPAVVMALAKADRQAEVARGWYAPAFAATPAALSLRWRCFPLRRRWRKPSPLPLSLTQNCGRWRTLKLSPQRVLRRNTWRMSSPIV